MSELHTYAWMMSINQSFKCNPICISLLGFQYSSNDRQCVCQNAGTYKSSSLISTLWFFTCTETSFLHNAKQVTVKIKDLYFTSTI